MNAPQIEPMKDGRAAGEIPGWLAPYADNHDAARAALLTPEQPLFDRLWSRALELEVPGLSKREQDRLISFLQ